MAFSIFFTDLKQASSNIRTGRIQIGTFSESFEASVEYWPAEEYDSHWRRSIRRVVEEFKDSCLISSITDPETGNFLFWWPIYLLDRSQVAIQHQVHFLNEDNTFDPDNPYRSLRSRETTSECGEQISEWLVPLNDLAVWLSS